MTSAAPRQRTRVCWLLRGRLLTIEGMVVLAVIIALELAVFADYFSGKSIPAGDFISAYNFEAYSWWHDGSFFDPTQWMPLMWGGYPSVSNLQNSSFYLPVGLMAALTPFTLHTSAILSALHVAFGSIGIYVFSRRWGITPRAAMIGLVSWFFAIGFYSNAAHLDIMRAYAWLPWVLLVTSVKWPWSRWWAAPAAVLILWQTILSVRCHAATGTRYLTLQLRCAKPQYLSGPVRLHRIFHVISSLDQEVGAESSDVPNRG